MHRVQVLISNIGIAHKNRNGSKNFVVPPDAFEKVRQKLSLLNLSKKDDIISATFFENIVTTKFEN